MKHIVIACCEKRMIILYLLPAVFRKLSDEHNISTHFELLEEIGKLSRKIGPSKSMLQISTRSNPITLSENYKCIKDHHRKLCSKCSVRSWDLLSSSSLTKQLEIQDDVRLILSARIAINVFESLVFFECEFGRWYWSRYPIFDAQCPRIGC